MFPCTLVSDTGGKQREVKMKRHIMNLTPAPLKMIREGRKTIELRLYDEKRKQISIGDIITFVNTEDDIASVCRVKK